MVPPEIPGTRLARPISTPPRAPRIAVTARERESGSAELCEDFVGIGESSGFVLRVDERAVHDHVEDTVIALDELGFDASRLLDSGRQPGGLREVVSTHTVGDGDLHSGTSSLQPRCELL
jgi:hypothetical protein